MQTKSMAWWMELWSTVAKNSQVRSDSRYVLELYMVKISMNKLTVGEGVPPHSGISLPNVSLKAKFAASDTSSSIDIPLGIAAKLLTVGTCKTGWNNIERQALIHIRCQGRQCAINNIDKFTFVLGSVGIAHFPPCPCLLNEICRR